MRNFIFVTGGVLSSLGKGVTTGALGALLESMGYKVQLLKLDPYLNVDPGTISPYQHGEVFVTDDGAETDLDLGHYERFTHDRMTKDNNATAGQMYAGLLDKERKGEFLGATVQMVPHLTNEIKDAIYKVAKDDAIVLVEIGGTVGDIESEPFIEAIRQIGLDKGNACSLYVHLTYVPYLETSGELKTKPTQHSVKELRALGIQPHIIFGRSEKLLPDDIKEKISLFTNVPKDQVISIPNVKNIYEVLMHLNQKGLSTIMTEHFDLPSHEPDLKFWRSFNETLANLKDSVEIAIVGKYVELRDAYKSVRAALIHAQVSTKTKVNVTWIDAEDLNEANADELLGSKQGILVPGGFGERGVEGKMLAARYARENKIPYLGICLGMQIAVISFARDVLKMADAHSTEFAPNTKHPVVDIMVDQKELTTKGGNMRLGASTAALKKGTLAYKIYGSDTIQERHRHRYEFNTAFVPQFEEKGLIVSGYDQKRHLPEIIEIPEHPFFIAGQFHPEYKSRPWEPHPLFVAFIDAAKKKQS